MIEKWKEYFGLDHWTVTTEEISHDQIEYNGHKYFVGIARDFDNDSAVIYHDKPLTEECVVHELLHVVFPKPNSDETYGDYEKWITDAAENIVKNQ